MEIKRTGLDLVKYVFEVHAVDMTNRWCFAKRSGAMLLLRSLPSWSPCIISMEACCGSHYWARVLTDLGREVRLISPRETLRQIEQERSQRRRGDLRGGWEANNAVCPSEIPQQLEIQAVHRIRQQRVANRTRLVNQVRRLIGEHGILVPRDLNRTRRNLSEVVDGPLGHFGELFVEMLRDIREVLTELDVWLAG